MAAVHGEAFGGHASTPSVSRNDFADANVLRLLGQVHATALAPHCLNPSVLAQEMHDLGQVILRHIERLRDFCDGRAPRRLRREVDEQCAAGCSR